ncbi:MAG: hypothetical protein LUQ11_02145 [Methylococcaceae bacterium]|nr:hypothetical protein [Methylococcaceae bacterium]
MTWEESFRFVAAVLTSIGGGVAIVFGFSSWLGKVWASRILSREKYELEKLRHEHEVRFSKLHLERAEAIKELAQCLQQLDDSLHSFLKDFQPVNEPDLEKKVSKSIELHNEFVAAYKKHRIFFSRETEELMHRLALCSRDTFIDIQTYPVSVDHVEFRMTPELLKNRDQCWQNARKAFQEDILKLKEALEDTFREILGIAPEAKKPSEKTSLGFWCKSGSPAQR